MRTCVCKEGRPAARLSPSTDLARTPRPCLNPRTGCGPHLLHRSAARAKASGEHATSHTRLGWELKERGWVMIHSSSCVSPGRWSREGLVLRGVSPPEVWSVERCGGFLGIFGERPRSDRKYPETLHNPPHPPHRARGVFGSARFGRRSRRGRRPSLSGLEGHADQSRGLAVGLGLEEAIENGLSGADGYRVGPEGIHEHPGTRDAG